MRFLYGSHIPSDRSICGEPWWWHLHSCGAAPPPQMLTMTAWNLCIPLVSSPSRSIFYCLADSLSEPTAFPLNRSCGIHAQQRARESRLQLVEDSWFKVGRLGVDESIKPLYPLRAYELYVSEQLPFLSPGCIATVSDIVLPSTSIPYRCL